MGDNKIMARFRQNAKELKEAAAAVTEKTEAVLDAAAKAAEDSVEAAKPVMEKAVREAADKAETTAKKARAAVKKTVSKFEPKKTSVVFEANGRSFNYDDIVKAVNKACKGQTAKKLEIYVNSDEQAAYYVLDGVASPDYRVQL